MAGVLFGVTSPWLPAAPGTGPGVAHQAVFFLSFLFFLFFLRPVGPLEGSREASALVRVTLLGTAVQLPLAYAQSGFGARAVPGVPG
ncbi:hypothetical protein ACWEKM_23060 [Streptomyces sp. NPDC004752]